MTKSVVARSAGMADDRTNDEGTAEVFRTHADLADRILIVVSPEQRAVIVLTSRNDRELRIGEQDFFPLVTTVIMPALDR